MSEAEPRTSEPAPQRGPGTGVPGVAAWLDSRQGRVRTFWGIAALLTLVYLQILRHMIIHWRVVDDYSHGFLVAPLAAWFAYERRGQLSRIALEGSWWGLGLLAIGLLSLAVGRLGVELTTMRWGFVFSLHGFVLLLLGREAYRVLLFPLAFLFLMVPLPQSLVNTIAFPLQLVASRFAVESLHVLGIPALLEGNIIHLANAQLFVAEACSGLRSLMALLTLGVVFSYFFRTSNVERLLLVLSTIPIAIFVNALRVALTGILSHHFGEAATRGAFHDFQGVFTFVVAFFVLLGEARVFEWLRPLSPSGRRASA